MSPETWVAVPPQARTAPRRRREKAPLAEPVSLEEYNRLQQGESASWFQIISEHPMIGTRTIEEMLSAGALRVSVHYDPVNDQVLDIRLVKKDAAEQHHEGDRAA